MMLTELQIQTAIDSITDEIARVQNGEVYAPDRALQYLEGAQHALEAVLGDADMIDPTLFTTAGP